MSNTYTWSVTSAPTPPSWVAVTSSSTGQYLAASNLNYNIYTSNNFGQTWSLTTAPTSLVYTNMRSSSNGQYIYAAGSSIQYSTNFGSTWSQASAPTTNTFTSICCDSTGQFVYAGNNVLGIYKSSNYGQTWTQTSATTSVTWLGICCSYNGQYISAIPLSGTSVYYSSNYGSTWSSTVVGGTGFTSITCDSTGLISFATYNGGIYKTTNQWSLGSITLTGAPSANWNSICCNSTATIVAATVFNGGIWISTDSGTTWTQSTAPGGPWQRIRTDEFANYLIATGTSIYIGTNNTPVIQQPGYLLSYSTVPSSFPSTLRGYTVNLPANGSLIVLSPSSVNWIAGTPSLPAGTWLIMASFCFGTTTAGAGFQLYITNNQTGSSGSAIGPIVNLITCPSYGNVLQPFVITLSSSSAIYINAYTTSATNPQIITSYGNNIATRFA